MATYVEHQTGWEHEPTPGLLSTRCVVLGCQTSAMFPVRPSYAICETSDKAHHNTWQSIQARRLRELRTEREARA